MIDTPNDTPFYVYGWRLIKTKYFELELSIDLHFVGVYVGWDKLYKNEFSIIINILIFSIEFVFINPYKKP